MTLTDQVENQLHAPELDLRALTGIRFFAASYVVLYHSKLSDNLLLHHHRSLGTFLSHGVFAVELFFILSGLILAYSYQGRVNTPQARSRFWEARFARVWPLYALSLVASSVLNHTTPHLFPAICTLLMIQSWNPMGIGSGGYWNFVCWTLSCEAFFYLVFPWLQRYLGSKRSSVGAICLVLAFAVAAGFHIGSITFASSDVHTHLPLAVIRFPDFLIGVCLGNFLVRQKQSTSRIPWLTWIGMLASAYCLSGSRQARLSATVLFLGAFLYGLATERSLVRKLLSTRIAVIGGAISYAVYLFQWPIKALTNDLCNRLHAMRSANEKFVLYLVLLCLTSYLLYSGIEEPAREKLRAIFGMRRARPLTS